MGPVTPFPVRRSKIHGELDAWVSVFSTTVERQALNVYVLLTRWREEQTQTTFFGSWKNLSFSKWCCFDFFRCIVFIWKWKSGSNTYPWNKRGTSTLNQQKTHIPTLYTLKNISHIPFKSIQKTSFWTYPQNLCQPSPFRNHHDPNPKVARNVCDEQRSLFPVRFFGCKIAWSKGLRLKVLT